MNHQRLTLLQDMPVFGGVREDILEFLIDQAAYASFDKGQFLFKEEEPGDSMMVLECGQVAVLKHWEEKEYLLGKLGAGDCVGEMSILDLNPRSASVAALSPCEAMVLHHGLFYQLHKKDLAQYALIMLNVSREVCRRLRTADQQLFQVRLEADLVDGEYFFHQ